MTAGRAPAWAVLALAAGGCAALAAPARERALERQLDAWSGAAPLDRAWQESRRLLAERGYPLAGKDASAVGQAPMPTAELLFSPARETVERGPLERSLSTGWTRARDRYRVESTPAGGRWRIVFLRFDEASNGRPAWPVRDVELELALVRRVDPDGAARIEVALSAPVATRD